MFIILAISMLAHMGYRGWHLGDDEDDKRFSWRERGMEMRKSHYAKELSLAIFSDPKVRENFEKLRRTQGEIEEVVGEDPFNEKKTRVLINQLGNYILESRAIVIDRVIIKLKELESFERKKLVRDFFRRKSFRK